MPIAIASLGWKTYMMNGAWDVLMFFIILFWWVETKGKTLEGIDEAIDGVRHTTVPRLDKVLEGKEDPGEYRLY